MNGTQEKRKFESVQNVTALTGIRNIGNANEFYVYLYLDKTKPGKYVYEEFVFEYEPFYVGKGCKDRLDLRKHKNQKFTGSKINKLGKENIITVTVLVGFDEVKAFKLEERLVKLIGRRARGTGPLTNLDKGGWGNVLTMRAKREMFSEWKEPKVKNKKLEIIEIPTQKPKRKQSAETVMKRAESNRGKKRTLEQREHLSKVRTGEKRTEEARRKMSEAAKNRSPVSEETKRKMSLAQRNRKPLSEKALMNIREGQKKRKVTCQKL